ncbi:unnamed protein product, partial [Cladocopium goreaui]
LGEVDQCQASHFLEVFAGDHMLHSGVQLEGLQSRALDVNYTRKMDLATAFGFILAVNFVRHVRQQGCAWFALPCSSWVFLSQGSTKRHFLRPQGWNCFKSTAEGNRLARRLAYLLELCHKLKIFYIIEQPESSLLFRYKPFWRLLKKHGAHRVKCSLGAFNALTVKPVVFWGTAPFLKKLSRQVTSKQRSQLRRIRSFLKLDTARVYRNGAGETRC